MSRPLLIDTDPGIDDALALLLAFASPEVSVEAVTTVAGNVPVDVATAALFRILDVARPARMPRVAKGAVAPLARPLVTAAHYHGDDGLGNLDGFVDPDGRPRYPARPRALEDMDGPDLILDSARRFAGELVVVALGPLTNVATAISRDRRALDGVTRLVVMGGAVAVPGNTTPAAEFNFHADPEAAALVLGAGLPVELVPLDATRQTVLFHAALDARLRGREDRHARFVADFTAHAFDRGAGALTLHDPLAVGLAVDPSLAASDRLHVDVECRGALTRGMSVADRRPVAEGERLPANCAVAMRVRTERFLDLFLERLCLASA
jgi:inosine-uridine nucleoside N-ribohydrolase